MDPKITYDLGIDLSLPDNWAADEVIAYHLLDEE